MSSSDGYGDSDSTIESDFQRLGLMATTIPSQSMSAPAATEQTASAAPDPIPVPIVTRPPRGHWGECSSTKRWSLPSEIEDSDATDSDMVERPRRTKRRFRSRHGPTHEQSNNREAIKPSVTATTRPKARISSAAAATQTSQPQSRSLRKRAVATPNCTSGEGLAAKNQESNNSTPQPSSEQARDTLEQRPPLTRRNSSIEKRATRTSAPGARPPWADSQSERFDLIKWLHATEYHPVDSLAQRPPPENYSYIDSQGRLKNKAKYASTNSKPVAPPEHPRVIYHRKNGSLTPQISAYYKDMPRDRNMPIAGLAPPDPRISEVRSLNPSPKRTSLLFPKLLFSGNTILQRTNQEQEEAFYSRPSVKLVIPDHVKAILVDDWENVTKNQLLVPVPAEKPVETILNDYLEFEKPRRVPGSAQMDVLEEVVAGLKEYFERCLGRILLYRFERNQYIEVREGWAKSTGDLAGKTPTTTYGAEHFCRLIVSLPELIAQTNMDQQSINRLREELTKLTNWLGKESNMQSYFVSEYETPGQQYVEKAKSL